MSDSYKLLFARAEEDICLSSRMANRHGLIAGATGTGKTVSLKVLAEAFSSIGVPVFLADIKGDVASLCNAGGGNPKIDERINLDASDAAKLNVRGTPTIFVNEKRLSVLSQKDLFDLVEAEIYK